MTLSTPDLDAVITALTDILPRFTLEEQRLALALYQELARGAPVRAERLASRVGISTPDVERLLRGESLRALCYRDDGHRIVGFGGLAVVPMHHRLLVADQVLYTWCAWDSLFIPEMIGRRCVVESKCPETGEVVRLTIDPSGVASRSHPDAVVSFLLPAAPFAASETGETMASFCHFVFFFASRAAGATWTSRHPGSFLLSIDDAFELGRWKNGVQFGEAWAAQANP